MIGQEPKAQLEEVMMLPASRFRNNDLTEMLNLFADVKVSHIKCRSHKIWIIQNLQEIISQIF